MGTIVEKLRKDKNVNIIIASGDMDTMQLIDGKKVQVYTLKKGINDTILYNEEDVEQIYSCYAEGLHRFNNVEIAEVDKFYDEVTKLFLFKILADDLS